MTLKLDNHVLHIDYPSAGQHVDAPLNGVDAEMHGPNLEGVTYGAQLAGNHELLFVTKHHGEVFSQGSLKLSNDGRTITETWWNPVRPDDANKNFSHSSHGSL
jgi:hypothetical protein